MKNLKANKYSVTDRFVLHVGYLCNERCKFCYYLDQLNKGKTKNWTTKQNKRRIKFAAFYGKKAIDISGGEPTIRKDLPELIAYCKSKNLQTINIITNGIKTSKIDYCKKLQNAGLTEGLFSIHSHDAKIHDDLTQVSGSHDKLFNSLKNFKKLGLQVRINTVINNKNYKFIDDFLELISPYQPKTVNLIVFNPSEEACFLEKEDRVRISDYQIIGDAISSALDKWKSEFNVINVRFLPFCFLKKYPENIRTQWQKFFEDQEWDPFLNVSFQKGFRFAVLSSYLGFFMPWNVPKFISKNYQTLISKLLSAFRMKYSYKKGKPCLSCDVTNICTGLAKDYVDRYGFPEVTPITEMKTKIIDPLYYCTNYKQNFKSLLDI